MKINVNLQKTVQRGISIFHYFISSWSLRKIPHCATHFFWYITFRLIWTYLSIFYICKYRSTPGHRQYSSSSVGRKDGDTNTQLRTVQVKVESKLLLLRNLSFSVLLTNKSTPTYCHQKSQSLWCSTVGKANMGSVSKSWKKELNLLEMQISELQVLNESHSVRSIRTRHNARVY